MIRQLGVPTWFVTFTSTGLNVIERFNANPSLHYNALPGTAHWRLTPLQVHRPWTPCEALHSGASSKQIWVHYSNPSQLASDFTSFSQHAHARYVVTNGKVVSCTKM